MYPFVHRVIHALREAIEPEEKTKEEDEDGAEENDDEEEEEEQEEEEDEEEEEQQQQDKIRYRSSEGQFWWSKSFWRMPKQPLQGPRGHPKQAKYSPTTLPRPSSAARSEQTRPKRVPRRIWKPSLVDLEAPKSSQESPKSSQKEPERAPQRLHNHFWIENVDFSNM